MLFYKGSQFVEAGDIWVIGAWDIWLSYFAFGLLFIWNGSIVFLFLVGVLLQICLEYLACIRFSGL